MTDNLEPLVVNATQAAKMLGISRPHLYKYINRADFPSVRLGGRVLISVDGLRKWVAKQTEEKTA